MKDHIKQAEQAYLMALEAGEVGEQDKEAVIIGALWALKMKGEENENPTNNR